MAVRWIRARYKEEEEGKEEEEEEDEMEEEEGKGNVIVFAVTVEQFGKWAGKICNYLGTCATLVSNNWQALSKGLRSPK